MNKVLYVARKVKGLTEVQIAQVLKIEEQEYIKMERSVTEVSAPQALQLAKLFDLDAELFLHAEGRDVRLLKYASDQISGFMKSGYIDTLPPQYVVQIVSLGNAALRLAADLNHAIYRQYELEQDNEALRKLIAEK
jgi:transcriptional regulator with XRE-family HTH domain